MEETIQRRKYDNWIFELKIVNWFLPHFQGSIPMKMWLIDAKVIIELKSLEIFYFIPMKIRLNYLNFYHFHGWNSISMISMVSNQKQHLLKNKQYSVAALCCCPWTAAAWLCLAMILAKQCLLSSSQRRMVIWVGKIVESLAEFAHPYCRWVILIEAVNNVTPRRFNSKLRRCLRRLLLNDSKDTFYEAS